MSDESDFTSAVATRARTSRDAARDILARHQVPTTDVSSSGDRRLLVTGVRFTGMRPEGHDPRRIDFGWTLTAGLHAVASWGNNLCGKSSVLNVVLWALRGRPGDLR